MQHEMHQNATRNQMIQYKKRNGGIPTLLSLLMPQTGIEPFYLISNTDRKGL